MDYDAWAEFERRMKLPGNPKMMNKFSKFSNYRELYEVENIGKIVFYEDMASLKNFTGFVDFGKEEFQFDGLLSYMNSGYIKNGEFRYLQSEFNTKDRNEMYVKNGFYLSRTLNGERIKVKQKKFFSFEENENYEVCFFQGSSNHASLIFKNHGVEKIIKKDFNLKSGMNFFIINSLLVSLETGKIIDFIEYFKLMDGGKLFDSIKGGLEKLFPEHV